MDLRSTISVYFGIILFTIDFTESKRPKQNIPNNGCKPYELCEDVKKYPLLKITKMLKKNKRFKLLSGSVMEPANVILEPQLKMMDDSFQEENMCRTKKVTVSPRVGIGRYSRVFIANTKDFQQTVEYEICVDPDKHCYANEVMPQNIQTYCRQSYTWVRLLAMNRRGKLELQPVRVPSTCVCSYKKRLWS